MNMKGSYKFNFSAGGDVLDSMNFILNNLKEMNKLWIRMAGKDKGGRKEKERIALNQTIGENLHRLSQLEGVNLTIYQNEVFPRLLDLVFY